MFLLNTYKNHTACITSQGLQVSYEDLQAFSLRISAHIEPHQLIFALCSNNVASLAGYVAFVNHDNATLLLDAHTEETALMTLYGTYCPRYIWGAESGTYPADMEVIYREDGYVLLENKSHHTPVSNDLSLLLSTSGSTGSPKLVRLSKQNLCSNAQSIIEYLHLTASERPITSLPMYYSFGLSIINSHLLVGATILLTEASYVEREFWSFAVDNGVTSFSGVPYTFEILKKLKIWKMDIPSLKTITQAGGKLNDELITFFTETYLPKGVQFYVMYGQTEATARMSYLDPQYSQTKLGSIGKCIPGGQLFLIDQNGQRINETHITGELVYTGANVSLGYAERKEDLVKSDDNHGVLHTGDLAYTDEDGFFYIIGRKKRFVKLFGNRISLDYIETLLRPLLHDCVCVGNDSQVVIYTTDTHFDEEEIINTIVARTKIVRTTFTIRHIEVIPRSDSGKIQYSQLPI